MKDFHNFCTRSHFAVNLQKYYSENHFTVNPFIPQHSELISFEVYITKLSYD